MDSLSADPETEPNLTEDASEQIQAENVACTKREANAGSKAHKLTKALPELKCQFCLEILPGIFKLNKHLKKVHNARINITCNLCGEKFKRNKEFKVHLTQSHAKSPPKTKKRVFQKKPRKNKERPSESESKGRNKREVKSSKKVAKAPKNSKKRSVSKDLIEFEGTGKDSAGAKACEDSVWDGDNDFSSVEECDNELRKSSAKCTGKKLGDTAVVLAPEPEATPDIEVQNELEEPPPKKCKERKQVRTKRLSLRCSKCRLTFKNPEIASIHTTFHTLKLNAQLRCPDCRKYLKSPEDYRNHAKIHQEVPNLNQELDEHRSCESPNGSDSERLDLLETHFQGDDSEDNGSENGSIAPQNSADIPEIIDLPNPWKNLPPTPLPDILTTLPTVPCLVPGMLTIVFPPARVPQFLEMTLAPAPPEIRKIAPKILSKAPLIEVDVDNGELSPKTEETPQTLSSANRRKAGRKEATAPVMYREFVEEEPQFLDSDEAKAGSQNSPKKPQASSATSNPRRNRKRSKRNYHKEVICEECGRKFRQGKAYRDHLETHRGLTPFKCVHCEKVYSCGESLRRHILSSHDPAAQEKKFLCAQCGRRYATSHLLVAHLYFHKRKDAFGCETCGRRFRSKGMLERCVRGHLGEASFKCTECDRSFVERRKFTYHMKRHAEKEKGVERVACDVCGVVLRKRSLPAHRRLHGDGHKKPYQCPHCENCFHRKRLLNLHLRKHPEFTGNVCGGCGKEFPSKELMEEHALGHPPKKRKLIVCEICGLTTHSPGNLEEHMKRHTGERTYQCHECGKMCKTKNDLRIHGFSHSKTKPYSCTFCDYTSKYPTLKFTHTIQRHFGPDGFHENDKLNSEKTFFCEICNSGFVKEASLQQHRLYHEESKSVKCRKPGCEEMFFSNYDRMYHVRVFHGKKKCEFCGREYLNKNELDQHRRYRHTGEAPFECSLCNKRYKSFSDLSYHMAIHKGDYKYSCEFCEKKFIARGNLNAHVRTHTGHTCRKCGVACGSAKAWKEHRCVSLG